MASRDSMSKRFLPAGGRGEAGLCAAPSRAGPGSLCSSIVRAVGARAGQSGGCRGRRGFYRARPASTGKATAGAWLGRAVEPRRSQAGSSGSLLGCSARLHARRCSAGFSGVRRGSSGRGLRRFAVDNDGQLRLTCHRLSPPPRTSVGRSDSAGPPPARTDQALRRGGVGLCGVPGERQSAPSRTLARSSRVTRRQPNVLGAEAAGSSGCEQGPPP